MMINVDMNLSDIERTMLKECMGQPLCAIEAKIAACDNMAWHKVKVTFGGFALDIANEPKAISFSDADDLEEFGVLGVKRSDGAFSEDGIVAPVTTIDVNGVVRSVFVVNNRVETFIEGTKVNCREYCQAIAFGFENDHLVFDKEVWFDEMVTIKRGKDLARLVYDDSVDWEDDLEEAPDIHYEHQSIIEML